AAAVARALDGQAGPPPAAIEIEQALARLHRQLDASDGPARLAGVARSAAAMPGVPLTEPIEVPVARANGPAALSTASDALVVPLAQHASGPAVAAPAATPTGSRPSS